MTEAIKELLRSHNLKATPARVQVLHTLQKTQQPLRIEDVHQQMVTAVDPATVYRIINALVELGLVRQIDFGEHSAYFEPADRSHHHHVVCTQCGTVADIDYCPAQLEQKALAQANAFARVERHSLELFGVCKKCSAA